MLDGLDGPQQRAVTSTAAPLCILAGAGSGKTRVLTRRVAHRIDVGAADPRHVMALTFTTKAAGELRRRLGRLGVRDAVVAGTFHGLAFTQLRTRWVDQYRSRRVIIRHKARLLAAAGPAGPGERWAPVVAEIEWAKARLITPAGYQQAAEAAGRRLDRPLAEVAELFDSYERTKKRRGGIDFEDLLIELAHALETDAAFAAAQRWRFRHFFVDEFQDVNPAQFRLLRAWLGDRSDLCVVGDPNQAIYGWNGADPELLARFADHFPGAEVLALTRNYRSTAAIVAAAGAVLGEPGAPVTEPWRPEGPAPTVRGYDDHEAEAAAVARAVRDSHRPGVPWSHIAVLARTNSQLASLEESLRTAGIPVRSRSPFLDHPDVRSLLDGIRRQHRGAPLRGLVVDLELEAYEGALDADGRDARLALVRLGYDHLAVEPAATGAAFLGWLAATYPSRDDAAPPVDAVELATYHRAKGLEWPVVFLPGLEDGAVPLRGLGPKESAEERRLFYVATTRAIDELHCSWARSRPVGRRVVARAPSPWLALVEQAIAGSAEARWAGDDWRGAMDRVRAALAGVPSGDS